MLILENSTIHLNLDAKFTIKEIEDKTDWSQTTV